MVTTVLSAMMLLIPLTIFFSTAKAESDPELPGHAFTKQKWTFWVGGFFPNVESKVRLDSDLGSPGDGINLEDTLGLDDSKTVLWGRRSLALPAAP